MKEELLIVFVKNTRKGRVKTRLAETVGDARALQIYELLLDYTCEQAGAFSGDIEVWYSEYIPLNDRWDGISAEKRTQPEGDLGDRMSEAFRAAFDRGYRRVTIIGSDCADLTTDVIRESFDRLQSTDIVLGPSEDGGYYLLGMNQFVPALFEKMAWSTERLLEDTQNRIEQKKLAYELLPVLNDVDTAGDWRRVESRFTDASS